MAIDAIAGALIGGLADTGAAVGADVGLGAAAADAGAFGAADVGAVSAADAGALGAADLGAATIPDLSAGAGLDAANAAFGTFSPDLFGANAADVAAGGFGTDVGVAGEASDLAAGGSGALADTGATAAAGEAAPSSGVLGDFGVTQSGDLFSGTGLGPATDIGTGPTQPFGNVFSPTEATGAGGGGLSDVGSFGGGTGAGAPGGVGGVPATPNPEIPGVGAAETTPAESSGPLYSSSEGGFGTGGNQFDQTFNQFTTTDQGASLPTDMADRVGATPVATQSTTLDSAFPGASQSITGDIPSTPNSFSDLSTTGVPQSFTQTPVSMSDPLANSQLASMQEVGVPSSNVFTSSEMFAPPGAAPTLGAPTEVGTGTLGTPAAPALGTSEVAGPGPATVGTPTGTPTQPAAAAAGVSNAAPGAGSGTDALTALRMGAAGASIVSSGLNIYNALNQPSYSALQPVSYPGSTVPTTATPDYSGQTPLQSGGGTGGVAGGLAANRLTNGLLAGDSPQQLAAMGIISPDRAATLQSDYNGITQAYAQELGVSPQSLSPGIRQMIAARALADNNLGGR